MENLKPKDLGGLMEMMGVVTIVEGEINASSKMLGSQAKTRLWALEMVPKGFQCDDKAYLSKKQRLHMTKQQQKPNEKHVTILN